MAGVKEVLVGHLKDGHGCVNFLYDFGYILSNFPEEIKQFEY